MAEPSEAAARPPIEVDTFDDHDSVIDDDELSTFTASVTSSVLDYPSEHGRRYHAFRSGVYPLPNDELELDRLDLAHAVMVKTIDDRLFLAPIDPNKMDRILDIGTGTGIWSMAMGDEYPNPLILGNDLSAVQPTWVPPNVKFEIDDVEDEWVHDAPFDYIFCRYMAGCILNWPKLVNSVYANVKPGGWAEFQDFDLTYYSEDGSLKEDGPTNKWQTLLQSACRTIGREPNPGPQLQKWVEEAGFENITHEKFVVPLGPWPRDKKLKDVGMFNMANILGGLEAFSLRLFIGVLGWEKEEVLVLTSQVRKELKSIHVHAQIDFHIVHAQKPQ
ncbi:hypothetical protein OQA88_3067 [Cercophora sp. LCS_1]